jgi:quercetin dioxygenase-like cupin family protein
LSLLTPDGNQAVIVRSTDAEIVGGPPSTVQLLADASHTGGALTSQRVTLTTGADGAAPHRHAHATELFYVLGGAVQVLARETVDIANEGDLIVVPPTVAHAFAASPGSDADLLIVLTPGIDRFGYFRLLEQLGKGEATLEELLDSQDLYDNHFLDSPAWRAARDPGAAS